MLRLVVGTTLLLAASAAHAEDVVGYVYDEEDEPVVGTYVRVGDHEVQTDAHGRYRVTGLMPGVYRVTVDGVFERFVEVRANDIAVLDFTIDRGLIEDGVRVAPYADDALGVVPGAAWDGLGLGFGGSSSLENRYLLEGLDVTDVEYGLPAVGLPLGMVDRIDVLAGGLGAAHGRSTGAEVRITMPRGNDATHGSVFASLAPGALRAAAVRTPGPNSTIDAVAGATDEMVTGAEIGGPIVPRHAWYWIGIAPQAARATVTRTTRRRTDCRAGVDGELTIAADQPCSSRPRSQWNSDGVADVDPETGFAIYEDLDETSYDAGWHGVTLAGRIDAAIGAEHQGGVFFQVTPTTSRGSNDNYNAYRGWVDQLRVDVHSITTDVGLRWTSRIAGTLVTATIGRHRFATRRSSVTGRDDEPMQILYFEDLGTAAALGGESDATRRGCDDDRADDPYPGIENCPVNDYAFGGPGPLRDNAAERTTARLSALRRFGDHTVEVGGDVEAEALALGQKLSGDRIITLFNPIELQRNVVFTDDGPVLFTGRERHTSRSWAAFAEDVWRPTPELALELGLRHDAQSIDDRLEPTGMWSPRAGVAYDWTREGRARLFGHWGRYFESIPLHLATRSFATTTLEYVTFPVGSCSGPDCDPDDPAAVHEAFEPVPTAVDPDLRGQYIDEAIVGLDHELSSGARFRVSYLRRALGRVIEDVSDDATEYTITNRDARRDHDALTLAISGRVVTGLTLHASYTYSRTNGDYPGLYSSENGQLNPNLSAQYDLTELEANRDGPLPVDRPHYLKLDAYYTQGNVTLGGRVRALSGTPIDALAKHYRYGTHEAFLLPRGTMGRTPFARSFDLHVDYARELRDGVWLTLFADILNVGNDQETYGVDESYTYLSNANPIVGGSYEDLIWAKEVSDTGGETANPVKRNPNFGKTSSRYAPRSAWLGARLTF